MARDAQPDSTTSFNTNTGPSGSLQNAMATQAADPSAPADASPTNTAPNTPPQTGLFSRLIGTRAPVAPSDPVQPAEPVPTASTQPGFLSRNNMASPAPPILAVPEAKAPTPALGLPGDLFSTILVNSPSPSASIRAPESAPVETPKSAQVDTPQPAPVENSQPVPVDMPKSAPVDDSKPVSVDVLSPRQTPPPPVSDAPIQETRVQRMMRERKAIAVSEPSRRVEAPIRRRPEQSQRDSSDALQETRMQKLMRERAAARAPLAVAEQSRSVGVSDTRRPERSRTERSNVPPQETVMQRLTRERMAARMGTRTAIASPQSSASEPATNLPPSTSIEPTSSSSSPAQGGFFSRIIGGSGTSTPSLEAPIASQKLEVEAASPPVQDFPAQPTASERASDIPATVPPSPAPAPPEQIPPVPVAGQTTIMEAGSPPIQVSQDRIDGLEPATEPVVTTEPKSNLAAPVRASAAQDGSSSRNESGSDTATVPLEPSRDVQASAVRVASPPAEVSSTSNFQVSSGPPGETRIQKMMRERAERTAMSSATSTSRVASVASSSVSKPAPTTAKPTPIPSAPAPAPAPRGLFSIFGGGKASNSAPEPEPKFAPPPVEASTTSISNKVKVIAEPQVPSINTKSTVVSDLPRPEAREVDKLFFPIQETKVQGLNRETIPFNLDTQSTTNNATTIEPTPTSSVPQKGFFSRLVGAAPSTTSPAPIETSETANSSKFEATPSKPTGTSDILKPESSVNAPTAVDITSKPAVPAPTQGGFFSRFVGSPAAKTPVEAPEIIPKPSAGAQTFNTSKPEVPATRSAETSDPPKADPPVKASTQVNTVIEPVVPTPATAQGGFFSRFRGVPAGKPPIEGPESTPKPSSTAQAASLSIPEVAVTKSAETSAILKAEPPGKESVQIDTTTEPSVPAPAPAQGGFFSRFRGAPAAKSTAEAPMNGQIASPLKVEASSKPIVASDTKVLDSAVEAPAPITFEAKAPAPTAPQGGGLFSRLFSAAPASTPADDLSDEAALLEQFMPRDITPRDITPRAVLPRQITSRDITPRDITPKDITPRGITPRDVAPGQITSRDITPRDITPRDITSRNAPQRDVKTNDTHSKVVLPEQLSGVTPGDVEPNETNSRAVLPEQLSTITPRDVRPNVANSRTILPEQISKATPRDTPSLDAPRQSVRSIDTNSRPVLPQQLSTATRISTPLTVNSEPPIQESRIQKMMRERRALREPTPTPAQLGASPRTNTIAQAVDEPAVRAVPSRNQSGVINLLSSLMAKPSSAEPVAKPLPANSPASLKYVSPSRQSSRNSRSTQTNLSNFDLESRGGRASGSELVTQREDGMNASKAKEEATDSVKKEVASILAELQAELDEEDEERRRSMDSAYVSEPDDDSLDDEIDNLMARLGIDNEDDSPPAVPSKTKPSRTTTAPRVPPKDITSFPGADYATAEPRSIADEAEIFSRISAQIKQSAYNVSRDRVTARARALTNSSAETSTSFDQSTAADNSTVRTSTSSSRRSRTISNVPQPLWLQNGVPEQKNMESRREFLNKQLDSLLGEMKSMGTP